MPSATTTRRVAPEDVYARNSLIINVGRKLGLDYDTCEDLVQIVAIKCANNEKIVFNPARGMLNGYLARIAHNVAVDIYRKKYRLDPTDCEKLVSRIDANNCHVGNSTDMTELKSIMDSCIAELYRRYPSALQIDAFLMFARDGMKAKEVAKALDVNECYVNVAVKRCKKRLHDIFVEFEYDFRISA